MTELLGLHWSCALNSENEERESCFRRLPQLFLLVQAAPQQRSTLLSAGRQQLMLEGRRDGSSGLELRKVSRENIP
jgi:hypothetical protein